VRTWPSQVLTLLTDLRKPAAKAPQMLSWPVMHDPLPESCLLPRTAWCR